MGELRPSLPPSGVGAARLGGGKGELTGRGDVGASGDALSGVAVLFITTTTTTLTPVLYEVRVPSTACSGMVIPVSINGAGTDRVINGYTTGYSLTQSCFVPPQRRVTCAYNIFARQPVPRKSIHGMS